MCGCLAPRMKVFSGFSQTPLYKGADSACAMACQFSCDVCPLPNIAVFQLKIRGVVVWHAMTLVSMCR